MKELEKLFVPVKISAEVIKLGFDEYCFGYHNIDGELSIIECKKHPEGGVVISNPFMRMVNVNIAPMHEQVGNFLREKYNIHITINPRHDWVSEIELTCGSFPTGKYSGTLDDVTVNKHMVGSDTISLTPEGDSYHEAYNKAIVQAIDIIKNNK